MWKRCRSNFSESKKIENSRLNEFNEVNEKNDNHFFTEENAFNNSSIGMDRTGNAINSKMSNENVATKTEFDDRLMNENLTDEESNKDDINLGLNIKKLQTVQLKFLKHNQESLLNTLEIELPPRSPSKYMLGFDYGESRHLILRSGTGISVFGLYEVYPWLRAGLRWNKLNITENAVYILSPEIVRSRTETSYNFYTQIVLIKKWRFDFGIEGGYGMTNINEIYRRSENPKPNVININAETRNYSGTDFYAGAYFTVDITRSIMVGASVIGSGTEAEYYSGRLIFRI